MQVGIRTGGTVYINGYVRAVERGSLYVAAGKG